ncbi:thiol-disulfide oxidoreductase DCC family protein [Pseudomonas sp. NY15367]|jgi:predicted DCC family thiol-disulfide oxidoreductase YuxK
MHNCSWPLTLYYDGDCPLCALEIELLRRHAAPQRLLFVDIASEDFDPTPLGRSLPEMQARLHARWADGEWLLGLDASLWSWEAAGLGRWVAPLRWRPLRPLLEWGYRLFCRLRPHLAHLPHPDGAARCRNANTCSSQRPPSGGAG